MKFMSEMISIFPEVYLFNHEDIINPKFNKRLFNEMSLFLDVPLHDAQKLYIDGDYRFKNK